MIDFSPGMRVIIRDEEWMVKKVELSIKPFFIDLNYADDLCANLAEYGEVGIISGREVEPWEW